MTFRSPTRIFSLAALAAVILALGAPPLLAQDEELPGLFGEVIDVRVVNLEVVVTDKKGERVRGLGPEDFVLTVDGQERPVEYFSEVRFGEAVERDAASGSLPSLPALEPGQPVGTSFLVFIDDEFSLPHDRNRVLDALAAQAPLMGPRDMMAVVAFNGDRVEMLANWTNSTNALDRAFAAARQRPAHGLLREVELRRATRFANFSSRDRFTVDGRFGRRGELSYLVSQQQSRIERMTLAATTALRSFADPPGRKVMLLLSGGWPYASLDALVGDASLTEYSDFGWGGDFYRELLDTANRLSYTLYPVDVRGQKAAGLSAEYGSSFEARAALARDLDREFSENSTLQYLARETGGKAFLNSARVNAFEGTLSDTRSYYWLGFTPEWRGEDERHRVRVKPRDPSLKMRTRKSFSDLSRQSEVTMMVESALLFGAPPGDQTLTAALGESERAGWGKMSIPVAVEIPLDAVTFLPGESGFATELELRLAVEDKNGDRAQIPIIPLRFRVDELPEAGATLPYTTNVKLRRIRHDLVVSLYDKASGSVWWTRLAVDPG